MQPYDRALYIHVLIFALLQVDMTLLAFNTYHVSFTYKKCSQILKATQEGEINLSRAILLNLSVIYDLST